MMSFFIRSLLSLSLLSFYLFIPLSSFATNPTASGLYMTGGMKHSHTIEVFYTYFDADSEPESGTTFQWFRYDDNCGTNPVAIAGATSKTYTLTAAEVGKHIGVVVTPRDNSGEVGTPVIFQPWTCVAGNENPVYSLAVTCNKPSGVGVPSPGNDLDDTTPICSPRPTTWEVTYTGINYRLPDRPPRIIINWGDGNIETVAPALQNTTETNMEKQQWQAIVSHTYDYDGGSLPSTTVGSVCTYTLRTTWALGTHTGAGVTGLVNCITFGEQTQPFTVWDTEDNVSLGQIDINHDPTSTGTVGNPPAPLPASTENVNVCEDDTNAVRLIDNTDFNCTDPLENPRKNDQGRWVQWVYGTTGTTITAPGGAGGSIIINGVSYTAADLPVYGRPVFLPATTATAFLGPSPAITDDISMPTTAAVGEQFFVTMRSWNFCNRFDRNIADACALNPPQGAGADVFNIYGTTNQTALSQYNSGLQTCITALVVPYYANANPVTREYTISIIDSPDPPVVPDRDVCSTTNTSTLDQLSVSTPLGAGFLYRWWSDAALTTQLTTGTTFNPNNTQAPNGQRTHFWVTVESTSAGSCRSPATEVRLIKRTSLSTPPAISVVGIPSNPDDFCPNTTYSFTVTTAPGNITVTDPTADPDVVFATDYFWTLPAGWTLNSGQGTETISVTTSAVTGSGTISVVRQYETGTSTPPAAVFCPSTARTKSVNVQPRPTASILPSPAQVCETNSLQLNGNPTVAFGTILTHSWSGVTAILDDPNVQQPNVLAGTAPGSYGVTYTVTAEFDPGVTCAGSNTTTVTVDDNPLPASTGPNQDFCSVAAPPYTSNPLGGSNPAPGAGVWTIVSKPPTSLATVADFAPNNTTAGATFTGDQAGQYVLRWTVTNGQCTSFDDIQVDFGTAPSGYSAGADAGFCALTGSLNGTPPAVPSTLLWTQVSGPGTTTFSDNSVINPGVTVTAFGSYVYRLSVTSGSCPVPTDDVTIVFSQPVTATAPANFTSCVDNPPTLTIPVTGTISGPAGTTGRWEVVAPASGIFTSSGAANGTADPAPTVSDVYQPSVADFGLASITLRLRALDPDGAGPCGDVTSTVVITLDKKPSNAVVGANFSTCGPTATLNGTAANNGGIGTWSIGNALYYETFPTTDNGLGITGPPAHAIAFNHPSSNWSLTIPANNIFLDANDWLKVDAGRMSARDVNTTEVIWSSRVIAASGSINISAQATEIGNQAGTDYVQLFYKLDGGAEIQFGNITGDLAVDGEIQTFTANVSPTTNVQIVARMRNNGDADYHILDNVYVFGGGASLPIIADIHDPLSGVSNLQVGANAFRWTVTSALGTCTSTFADVTITRNALPVNNDPLPVLCEKVPAGGAVDADVTVAYLNTLVAAITGGAAGRTVEFYTDASRTVPFAGTIAFETGEQIFTRVIRTDVTPNCTQDGTITFTIQPLPVANDQLYAICEEAVGSADKDNNNLPTLFDNLVTGGAANRTVAWYLDPGGVVDDPTDLITLVPTPADVDDVADGIIFYALVTNTLTSCQNVASVEFDIRPRPGANPIVGQPNVCAGTTTILYQITNIVPGSTYTWSLPPNNPGFFEKFAGGGPNDFFVLLRFPGLVTPADPDVYNIFVTETSPNPDACSGVAQNFTITVESSPSANPIIGPNPVCKTQQGVVYQVTSINAANTYSWSIVAGDAAIVGASSGPGLGQIIVDFGTSSSSTLSVVETSPTGCALPAAQTLIVNANDQPVMTSPGATNLCSGAAVSSVLTFSSSIAANYSWRVISITGAIGGTAVNNTGTGNISETLTNFSGAVGSVTYRVTPETAAGCEGPTQDVVITVNPEPVIVTGQTKTVCSGSPANVEILLSPLNLPAGTVFDWPVPVLSDASVQGSSGANVASGVSGTIHINDVLVNTGGTSITATYTVTPRNGTCTGVAKTIVLTVLPEPIPSALAITKPSTCSDALFSFDPQNDISNGVPSTFSWTAVYQAGLTGGAATGTGIISETLNNISGATLNAVYTVTPTGANGCPGDPFTITMPIQSEPRGSNTVRTAICSRDAFNIDPQANITNGMPSTFSWSAVYDAGLTGGTTNGVGNIVETLTNASNSTLNAVYTITPTGSNGCAGNSFTITVPVKPEPVGAPSTKAAVCSDVAFSFDPQSDITNSTTSTFAWTAIYDPGLTGGIGSGIGLIAETLTNLTSGSLNATYTVIPTGTNGCAGMPFTVIVPVRREPVAADVTMAPGCSDTPFSFDPQNEITNGIIASFAWVVSYPAGLTGGVGSGTGVISETLTNLTSGVLNAQYTVTPTGSNGCLGNTFVITVPVRPEPVGAGVVKTAVCSDIAFSFDPQNEISNGVASNFTWTAVYQAGLTGGAGNGSSVINETLTNISSNVLNATYTVTPSAATGSCVGASFTITVPVRPEPVGVIGVKAAVCSDTPFSFNPQLDIGNGVTSTFTWTAVYDPGLTGGLNNGTGNIAGTLNNISGAVLNAVFTIIPQSTSGCDGTPFDLTVPVRSEPVGSNSVKAAVCSDVAFNIDPQNDITNGVNSTFTWTAIYPAGLTGGAGAGVGSVAETLTNQSGLTINAIYTITPTSANGCVGATFTITVPVDPEPVGALSTKPEQCSDVAFNFDPQNDITNGIVSTFSWTASYPAGVTGGAGSGNGLISEILTNVSGTTRVVDYTVIPTSTGGCVGAAYVIRVPVKSEPLGGDVTKTAQCSDIPFSINPQLDITNGITSTFAWTAVYDAGLTGGAANGVGTINATLTNLSGTALNASYTITPTGNNGCVGNTFVITMPINPEPVGTDIVLTPPICSDAAFSFDPQVQISNAIASSFTWTATYDVGLTGGVLNGIGPIGGTLSNETGTILNAEFTVTPTSNNGCVGSTFKMTVQIDPQPVLDPALATRTICSSDVTGIILNTNGVSIGAAFYNITLVSIDAGLGGAPTTGNALPANALQNDVFTNVTSTPLKVIYRVVPVGPPANNCLGDPLDITVTVNAEPVVNPNLDNSVCSRDVSGIILSTNGTSVAATSYRLVSVAVPGTIAANPANATVGSTGGINLIRNDRYTNTTSGIVTVVYEIVGISTIGPLSCEGQSEFINLDIMPEPILVPGAVSVCSGLSSNIVLGTAPGSAAITEYELKAISNPGNLVADGSNAGLGTYTLANFLANDKFTNTGNISRTITYTIAPVSAGCRGTDQTVVLTVNPAPAIANGLDEVVCSGANTGVVLSTDPGSVAASNYEVMSISVDAGLVPVTFNAATPRTTANINEISGDQFNNPTNNILTVTYNIVPISAASCRGPQKSITVTIEPEATVAITNLTPSICSNQPANIELRTLTQPSAGNVVFNITATGSSPLVTGFVPILSNLPNTNPYVIQDVLTNNDNVPQTVTYTITPSATGADDGNGCNGIPVPVVVTVEPRPKVNNVANESVCEGTGIGVTLVSPTVPSSGGIEFFVQSFPDAGITGSSNNIVLANNSLLNDVLSNPTSGSLKVRYEVTPRTTGLAVNCDGAVMTFEVTVKPNPVYTNINIANNPICSGDVLNITLTADVTESEVLTKWTVSAPVTIRGESNGAGDEVFQILFNDANTPGIADYTFTPKANGCTGPAELRSITVNPRPKITGLSNATICHGGTLSVDLDAFVAVAGTTFAWTVDDPSGLGVPASGTGDINQVLTNTTGVQATLTYTITPTGPGNCIGDEKVMLVTVAPDMNAQFTNPSDLYICKGGSDFLLVQIDGQAPLELVYNNGVSNVTLSNVGNFKVIQVSPTVTTTYTLVSVKDAFGCSELLNQAITVNVGETNANFNVVGPTAACSPFNTSMQFDQVTGTRYTWQWFDGSSDDVINAVTTVNGQLQAHTYTNPNPNGAITYKVTLRTELIDPNYPGGCFKSTTKNVTVHPSILLNTFAQPDTIICHGETIEFINQTVGATSHRWFYRVPGNVGQELDVRTSANVNYTFTNTTTTNPIVYEVIYRADNGNCPREKITLVTVYRGVTPSFNEGVVPPFVGGNATVTFSNTSVPVDGTAFSYDWSFGTDASPATLNSTNGSIPVNYSSPGIKQIILTITNVQALADGVSDGCPVKFDKTINILLPPLMAGFKVIPLAACFPADIEVTENTSTGDSYKWQVIDQGGRIAATSQVATPVFRIVNPGTYDVFLETSNSLTGQVAFAQVNGIEIYDLPLASFEARPTTLFVPDTELTTFNFSSGANQYSWDFDDGDVSAEFEPKHFYTLEGKYEITLVAAYDHGNKDLNGDGTLDGNVVCYDTARRTINAREGGLTKIPNAFTPNPNGPNGGIPGNGTFNDVFLPITKGVVEFQMQIFDRWGNLIFESTNKNQGWDGYDKNGNLMPAGVFVYKLTMRLADGQRTTQIGDVTLIR